MRVSGEKIAFLLFGVLFTVLTRILYIKRRWYAEVTVEFVYFYKSKQERDAKVDDTEEMFRSLLGYVFPPFIVFWLTLVALS